MQHCGKPVDQLQVRRSDAGDCVGCSHARVSRRPLRRDHGGPGRPPLRHPGVGGRAPADGSLHDRRSRGRARACRPSGSSPRRSGWGVRRSARRSPPSRSWASSTCAPARARTCAARRASCCRRPSAGDCSSARRTPPSCSSCARGSRSTSRVSPPAGPRHPICVALSGSLDRMRAGVGDLKAFARADLDFHNALARRGRQRHARRPAARRALAAAGVRRPRRARRGRGAHRHRRARCRLPRDRARRTRMPRPRRWPTHMATASQRLAAEAAP